MALVVWPMTFDSSNRGSMSYCFVQCEECRTLSCPFHPHHGEEVSVKEMMDEDDEIKKGTVISLTYSDKRDGTVTITLPYGGLTSTDFVESLVRPLMLALGYHPNTVDDALGCDCDGEVKE